jgi:hypothetical protein
MNAARTRAFHRRARPQKIPVLPTTRLGWWAVGLAVGYVVLVPLWAVMPVGAFPGLLSGLAGGVVALVAIRRRGERAVAVFAAVAPGVLVAFFVLGELLIGHD